MRPISRKGSEIEALIVPKDRQLGGLWPMAFGQSNGVTRQNRDRQKRGHQTWNDKKRDKLTLVVDNVGSCVKSPQILRVLAYIILEDSPRNFGLALKFSQIPIT